jgi:FkbM family methyltransferase
VSAPTRSSLGTWIRALGAPRSRALPALGARLGSHPRLAQVVLAGPQHLPIRRLRGAAVSHVTTPLVYGMDARLEVVVVGGSRMRIDTTDVAGRMLATSGVWEPHVTASLRSVLRRGDVVADVGANIGYFTLLAARLVGSAGRVYAVEPSPGTYAALLDNIGRNGLGNVTPVQAAAGAEAGEATLRDVVEGTNRGASSLRSDPERGWGVRKAVAVTVPMLPLADIVLAEEWPSLRVVKIDVEGFEADVVRGLVPILDAGHRPAVLVEVHTDIDPDAAGAVVELAERYGLRLRRIVDRTEDERIFAASHPVLEDVDGAAVTGSPDPRIDLLLSE